METKNIYRIELDGILLHDEYPNVDAAYKGAIAALQANPDADLANIVKISVHDIGMAIKQKKITPYL